MIEVMAMVSCDNECPEQVSGSSRSEALRNARAEGWRLRNGHFCADCTIEMIEGAA